MKNKKIEVSEVILISSYIFALITSSYIVLTVIGVFSVKEEDKLKKIKQCTQDGLGINMQYSYIGMHLKDISCCTKSELNCDMSNLGKTIN